MMWTQIPSVPASPPLHSPAPPLSPSLPLSFPPSLSLSFILSYCFLPNLILVSLWSWGLPKVMWLSTHASLFMLKRTSTVGPTLQFSGTNQVIRLNRRISGKRHALVGLEQSESKLWSWAWVTFHQKGSDRPEQRKCGTEAMMATVCVHYPAFQEHREDVCPAYSYAWEWGEHHWLRSWRKDCRLFLPLHWLSLTTKLTI